MKIKTLLIMTAALAIITSSMAGCTSKEDNLEEMIASNPEMAEQINRSLSNVEGDDMSVEVTYKENTIYVTGNLKTTYTKDILENYKDTLENGSEQTGKAFVQAVKQIEDLSGIEGVSIRLIVNNGDGKKIWERIYE